MPPPTSTTTARWLPKVSSTWSPEGATAARSSVTLVGEARPRPLDQGLRPVLARREQREVDRTPGKESFLPFHRSAAAELHDGGATPDGRHRALVLVDERLGRLTGHEPGDVR